MFGFDINTVRVKLGLNAEEFQLKDNQRSQTGSPFWSQDLEGRWYYMPVRLGDVNLHNPVMRIVSRKTIIETHMTERVGSVKEIINRQDYAIFIKGMIKRSDDTYPEEEVRLLNELYKRDEAIEIDSALTCVLLEGQDEMAVIKHLDFPYTRGENMILYEMELVTDIDFDLEINE